MASLLQLQQQFQTAVEHGLELSQLMERGQAQTPLGELFQSIGSQANQPLTVSLLCLTPEARQAAIEWLCGHDFSVFSLEVSKQIGLLEIQLKDRAYSISSSTGSRQEFNDWSALAQAISDGQVQLGNAGAGATAPGELNTNDNNNDSANKTDITLEAEPTTPIRQLNILLPESTEFIQQSPALMTRMLRDSNVMLVAAPPTYQLSDIDKQVLNDLLDDMIAFWPLLPIDELAADVAIPQQGWWQLKAQEINLAPTLLTTHVNAQLPAFLTQDNNELRQLLRLRQQSGRYQTACAALEDRYGQELKQLHNRKKREQRKQETSPSSYSYNSTELSAAKTQLGDSMQKLLKSQQEHGRKSALANSTSGAELKQYVEALSVSDLQQQADYKTIKLSLSEEYQHGLLGFIKTQLRQQLSHSSGEINTQLQTLAESQATALSAVLGYKPNFELPAVPKDAIWQDIKEQLSVELRYQGELPKRGFIDRLSEGRRSVFMLLMSASLLGYMGLDIRNSGWLGLIILPLFIGSIVYSYRSWQREDRARLEKEVAKVQEEVLSNARRLISDCNRQKQTKIADYLDDIKKQWLKQTENQGRQQQENQQAEQKAEAQKAAGRLQNIDGQISQWQQHALPLQQLLSGAHKLTQSSQQAIEVNGAQAQNS